ncbi:threonine/serine exporter family protein [Paraclostridium ghonii]|nr:threonine/serine exporter family protein [Paeniclostridium ghonii]MCM0166057.1 threonine/serine exporter family protein [Paeniclostridium ghonii]
MDQHEKKNIFRLALFTGELMLRNGAETYRVEDTILRICNSRGFKHVNVFTSPTVIIISDERFDGITFMKTIKNRGININKIDLLNTFSREFVSNKDLSINDALIKLKEIEKVKSYNQWVVYIGTGLASACFSVLLGCTLVDFLFTFITSIFAVILFDKIFSISSIPSFSTLAASIFIAVIGVSLSSLGLLSQPNTLIVGSIMPLLPGVSLIKGLRDLISGDLISGVARAFDAALTAAAIAVGVGFILDIWLRLGGIL